MTVRHKYESTTTGTVQEITVTTPSGFSDDVLRIRPTRDVPASGSNNNMYQYVLVDGNGTGWEYGYGKHNSSGSFFRDYVIESTNSNNRISLSSGNTHTVYCPNGGLGNRFAQMHIKENNKSFTSGQTQSLNMTLQTTGTTVNDFPHYSAPTSPSTTYYPGTILPYSRGWRATIYVEGTSTVDGYCRVRLQADGNYYSFLEGRGSFRLDTTVEHGCMLTTPLINHGGPFGGATTDGWFSGYIGVQVTNDSTGTATITGGMMIDWYL